jgi:membrane-associated phospholipid phosphatase
MRRPMNGAWLLALAIAVVDVIGLALKGFWVPLAPLATALAAGAGALALVYVYRRLRPDELLAGLAEAAAFLVLFTLALGMSSYLGTSLNRPLQDGVFDAADKALGFDFLAHMSFVAACPWVAQVLDYSYATSMLQTAFVVIALSFARQHARLRAYSVLFALTASATILIATIWPTIGTYAFYNVPDALLPAFRDPRSGWDQVEHIRALRAGTLQHIPLDDLRGLVSFPSFHTALAIITTWAIMPLRYARWPIMVLNFLLILATPSNGSHYLCDILGGTAIALAAIAALTGWQHGLARSPAPQPAEVCN